MTGVSLRGGGGGFTRPIPRDGGADQFRGIPIVGRLPTDGTRGPEEKERGRKWPDAEGPAQGSRARDARDPAAQNHSCCKKEPRLDQPRGDKSRGERRASRSANGREHSERSEGEQAPRETL